jgi:microcystin-dependent protein
MALNLLYIRQKQQPLTIDEHDANLRELASKLAPLDSPVFTGPIRLAPVTTEPEDLEAVPAGWVRQLVTGSREVGNATYAILGQKNVFTRPQVIPDATADNEAVPLGQARRASFETGDLKLSMFPRNVASGWISLEGQALPSDTSTDPNKGLYAALFALLGYQFGGSAALKYFLVPDARHRAISTVGPGVTNVAYPKTMGIPLGADVQYLDFNAIPDHVHNHIYPINGNAAVVFAGTTGGTVSALISANPTSNATYGTTGMVGRSPGQNYQNVMQATIPFHLLCKL